ncbi:esterase OVCA2 isoform X2 [Gadus macrocephalus]|uniref:esterase OVCA2 isoform X2 n=1 Tax=Gadus macrocephalus TaxID=80720 RepID=UPI0028CB38E4|nr:esterase OVCA2 isoform X2 [Gadus macrocephalus]
MSQRPLRVLSLHGYRQDGASFREKTGALRKLLKKQVELVYMTAPHHVTRVCSGGATGGGTGPVSGSGGPSGPGGNGPVSGAGEGSGGPDPRGWWFSDVEGRSFSAQQRCAESLGLEDSLAAVRAAGEELGPFDGVLGFSQGAALVAVLCALQERDPDPPLRVRFAVLVAGFRSACEGHRGFYGAPLGVPPLGVPPLGVPPLGVPSLHVFGLDDRVIPDAMSRELLPLFREPAVMEHPGGHFVPASSTHRQTYQAFLSRFL